MPAVVNFLCECGIRLNVVVDSENTISRDTSEVACPTPSCKIRHIISGHVVEIFIVDKQGNSTLYNWTTPDARTA